MSNPTNLREKLGASRLEEDDFVINDIALKIPPQQIAVNKQSYINKWDGLRLAHPQKSKSGHGIASVSFSTIFVGNVSINETLRPIVAGLRATPFCVVHNKYLSQCFQEISGKQEDRLYPYRKFQPVVLALTSMSFSTIPGRPDCINGRFDFIWFNYLPYTPIWAYKTGNTFDSPGPVWDSELWKQFYLPYLSDMREVSWPHLDHRVEGRMTFRWRDYTIRYTADSSIDKQTSDLINSIQKSPDSALNSWKSVIQDLNTNTQNVYDRYWNKLVEEGVISNPEAKVIKDVNNGTFTTQSQSILKPLMKRLSPQFFHGLKSARSAVNENKAAIQGSLAELNRRITQTKQLAEENSDFDSSGWELVDQSKMRIKFRDNSGNEIDNGGFNIFMKKRAKVIGPSNTIGIGSGTSIEGMSITFTPSLSVIPMLGHSYPTCQFCGGYDIDFTLDINDTNGRINQIQQIYDTWNKINLRFRMIPQGYRNILVENDFVQLFGIREWLPVSIDASTIPQQPGRTHAVLTFTHAGITSDTRLDDPEEIRQEFVRGSDTIYKKIWKKFDEHFERLPLFSESSVRLSRFRAGNRREEAFVSLLNEAVDNYNNVIEKIVGSIFSYWSDYTNKGIKGSRGLEYYSVFVRLTHSNLLRGFIPGLERMQKTVEKIKNIGKDSHRGPILRTQQSISNAIQAREVQREYTTLPGDDPKKQKFERGNELQYQGTSLEQAEIDINVKINELGIPEYQAKMNALFTRIINEYTDLPEFESIALSSKKEGINQGKPAYPDFKRSLSSVGSFLDASFSEGKLIEYDPDIYLWYPAYNGSLSSGVLGSLIDPILLNQARQHSIKVYDGAYEATSRYFKEKYYKNIGSDTSNVAPFKALKHYSGGELARELYKSTSYKNTTRETSEGETKVTTIPDPSKTPSNFYVEKNPRIKSDNEIQHSTVFEELWGGIQTDVGSQNRTGVIPQKGIQPEVGSISSPPIIGSDLGIENKSFTFSWPPKKSAQQPNENRLVSPIENYTRATDAVAPRRADATASSWEAYRRKAVVLDWKSTAAREKLQLAGFSDPNLASRQLALLTGIVKPVDKWSFNDYTRWKNAGTGRKLGYVHKGVDLWADVGTDVYAVTNGIVKYITKTPVKGAGLFIEILHPDCRQFQLSRYLHLQAINPKLRGGVEVKAGDRIGVVGRSGYKKTVPHLHFETWKGVNIKGVSHLKNGDLVNPISGETGIPWKGGVASGRKKLSDRDQQRYSVLANSTLDKDAMSSPLSPIKQSINEFEMSLIKGQGQRLTRAYPTFKLYFIEDDSGQRKRLAFDDFFSYNCVQSIRVVRSRKIAADLCILELINISGTLTNRKFRTEEYSKEFGNQSGKPRDSKGRIIDENSAIDRPMLANTKDENPIASLLLQEGIDIHLKIGYSNDPSMLDTVFTGKIQAINFSDTDDLITIVAQSHATELVQDIKGVNDPKVGSSFGLFGWEALGFKGGATTGRIIEEMLAQPEVIHFGRWERGDTTANRELLTNKYRFVSNPSDDNVFAPPPKEDFEMANGFIIKDLKYTIYRTTIWDILKEMELRHPNFIGSPVPYSDKYGERMTYFFGLPNQLYFARNPNPEEQMVQNRVKRVEEEAQENLRRRIEKDLKLKNLFDKIKSPQKVASLGFSKQAQQILLPVALATSKLVEPAWKALYSNVLGVRLIEDIHSIYRKKRLRIAREQGYITPFRKYHLYTSSSHIVSNNIKADARDTANTIVINYKEKTSFGSRVLGKAPVVGGLIGNKASEVDSSFVLKLDNALPTEDMRTQVVDCVNVSNEALAKNYALSILQQNIKDIYKGELVVIGDPSVKPYNLVFLLDEYSDMVGGIEVEQVTHVFTKDQGFLTEIKPDMVCAVSEWSTLSTSEALGIIMEGMVKKMFGIGRQSNQSPTSDASKSLSAWGQAIGSVGAFFGGFLARKIINFTQTGHPIITVPLLYHGRELSGGIPTRKLQYSIWETVFGEWKNKAEGDLSYGAWSEDMYDGIMKTIRKATGGYSTGSLNLWGQSTLDN